MCDNLILFNNILKKRVTVESASQDKIITHIDGSCRYQTVDGKTIFHRLLQEFYELTGCPILLNTSLNINGKPILGTAQYVKALGLDAMVIGNNIYE